MEPIIQINNNNNSKQIEIEKVNQISLDDNINNISKFSNLTITELKDLLNQKIDTFEILKIKSLIKDRVINDYKLKIESNEITISKENYKNYPPCLLEEKKVADHLCVSKKIKASATLSSDFNIFNSEHSANLNPGSIVVSTGMKGLTISDSGTNIIIGKVKEYDDFDWIGLYDHNDHNNSNYIKFWWSCNYETEISTSIPRDKNKTYFAKYFKYDKINGKFKVIDESVLTSDSVWIKIQGDKGEHIKLTWSNSETASSTSYVALYCKPQNQPSDLDLYSVCAFQYANKDHGVYSTQITNDGESSYYAVLWGFSSDDYFIKLSITDKIN